MGARECAAVVRKQGARPSIKMQMAQKDQGMGKGSLGLHALVYLSCVHREILTCVKAFPVDVTVLQCNGHQSLNGQFPALKMVEVSGKDCKPPVHAALG